MLRSRWHCLNGIDWWQALSAVNIVAVWVFGISAAVTPSPRKATYATNSAIAPHPVDLKQQHENFANMCNTTWRQLGSQEVRRRVLCACCYFIPFQPLLNPVSCVYSVSVTVISSVIRFSALACLTDSYPTCQLPANISALKFLTASLSAFCICQLLSSAQRYCLVCYANTAALVAESFQSVHITYTPRVPFTCNL